MKYPVEYSCCAVYNNRMRPIHDYDIDRVKSLMNETDPPRSIAEVGRILNIPPRSLQEWLDRHYRRVVQWLPRREE